MGDDFGLQAATLDWELQKAFTDSPSSGSVPLDWSPEQQSGSLEWDLTRLGPGPRDRLTFRIRVLDNDPDNGPKEGLSRTVTIRFPSVTESMEELSSRAGSPTFRSPSRKSTRITNRCRRSSTASGSSSARIPRPTGSSDRAWTRCRSGARRCSSR
ncbi:MAG: hypothetical protein U5K31_02835 [Balneolaceae bacterium]|nr:hypothetical protein [Balneolaceae bacterium]